jgi:hypothetical protein
VAGEVNGYKSQLIDSTWNDSVVNINQPGSILNLTSIVLQI